MLQKLASVVRNNDQQVVAPGFLRPIDTDRIARDFKIESIAAERGEDNLPETRDTNLDAVEQKIIQKIESEWAWQGDELLNSLRAYAARLVSYSIPAEFLKLQIQAEDALARLRVATLQARADLDPLQERYVGTRDELRDFRTQNRLSRPAREPAHRWTTLGLLFVFIAVESVLNGFFFAKGSAFGLVGGVGTAVGISLTNVALSFLLGLGPARWKNHRNFFIWTSGLLVTITGVVAIVALHLLAAHLRAATALVGEDKAFAAALLTIQKAPLNLPDMASFYLLGMGLIFSIGAIWKGYTFDDPYPRYGATYRREQSTREDYSDEHFALFDELSSIKDETVEHLRDGITRLPKYPQMAANVRAQRAAMLNGFRAYETSVETATNQLLKLYRDANRASRSTPPPSYFDEKWRLSHSFLAGPELKALLDDPGIGDVGSSLAELERLSKEVITHYERLHDRYPHPSEMS